MATATPTSDDILRALDLMTWQERREFDRLIGVPSFRDWCKTTSPEMRWDLAYQNLLFEYLDRVTYGDIDRLMIIMPPRHGKSETVTVRYAAWRLEREQSLPIRLGAYNATFAERFSRKVRRMVEAQGVQLAQDSRSVAAWETTAGGGLWAAGVGGGVTGTGARLIIIDDPVKSREEANSLTYRDRCDDWYHDDLYTRRNPGKSAIILIMTRWHDDDLGGRRLKDPASEGWVVLHLPAICDQADDQMGRPMGAELCPELWDLAELERTRTQLDREEGRMAFQALYQGRPVTAEGNMIKRAWWRRYGLGVDRERHIVTLPDAFDEYVMAVDCAFSAATTADYTVFGVWGRSGPNAFLLDRVKGQWEAPEAIRQFSLMCRRWPMVVTKLIEVDGGGKASMTTCDCCTAG